MLSLKSALRCIENFGQCSGLRANFTKTQAVWIGGKRGCGEEIETEENIDWNHNGKFKLLGIYYDVNKNDPSNENYELKLKEIRNLLSDWSLRNLSIIGKITVIKTLALPILVQCFTVLPDPDPDMEKEIQNLFFKFAWNNKPDKIKRSVLINTLNNGGLKMPHIKSFAQALKLSWIKKILDPNNNSPWKILLLDILENFGYENMWHLQKEGLYIVSKSLNPFWKNVVQAWGEITSISATAPETVLAQPLWYNKQIKIDNKSIFKKKWIKSGIFFINDLIDHNGNFLNHETFQRNFNITVNPIEFYGVIHSIPRNWKIIIDGYAKLNTIRNTNLDEIRTCQKVSKTFYHKFLDKIAKPPTVALSKWEGKLNITKTKEEWEKCFLLPFHTTESTTLQTFQFKILHRILSTNSRLMKCNMSETELCSFCNETKETIPHILHSCRYASNIWIHYRENLKNKCAIEVNTSIETILFGTSDIGIETKRAVNITILLIKRYLYVCRCKKIIPSVEGSLEFLNYNKSIELSSSHLLPKTKKQSINKSWNLIKDYLQ